MEKEKRLTNLEVKPHSKLILKSFSQFIFFLKVRNNKKTIKPREKEESMNAISKFF